MHHLRPPLASGPLLAALARLLVEAFVVSKPSITMAYQISWRCFTAQGAPLPCSYSTTKVQHLRPCTLACGPLLAVPPQGFDASLCSEHALHQGAMEGQLAVIH